jgi:hypothetical protein
MVRDNNCQRPISKAVIQRTSGRRVAREGVFTPRDMASEHYVHYVLTPLWLIFSYCILGRLSDKTFPASI